MVDEDVRAAVLQALDPDEVLALARALVAIPSENPGGTEDEVARLVVDVLTDLGASVEVVRGEAGRPSVLATVGSGGRPNLAWNGHLDVVPAGDPETWEHPPFAGTVQDGRFIGRGAVDMKGSVAAALAATSAVVRSRVRLGGTLELHLVADEEQTGVHGTKVLWEAGLLDQDACIVGEPTGLQLALAERGGAWVKATASGRAAHGSTPQLGVSAITSMARFLLRIDEVLPDREHPLVGRPSVNAALISGGTAPNVVPDRCEVDVDRRTVPGEADPAEVLEPFERLAASIREEHPEADLSFVVREWLEAAEVPHDSGIARAVRDAVAAETGRPPADVGFTGITDARFYINQARIPTVICGPGSLTVAHTANEWVPVDELTAAARIYARAFVDYLGEG
ncbi:MAG TPA: M20 family metallopeptidase [Actinomycetota bacterium]|nr:M20 family metallopeptidase [Actinomycetota bacterium]